MGVDWHGLAMGLHQNYTNKIARKLLHTPAYGSVLLRHTPGLFQARRNARCTHALLRCSRFRSRLPCVIVALPCKDRITCRTHPLIST